MTILSPIFFKTSEAGVPNIFYVNLAAYYYYCFISFSISHSLWTRLSFFFLWNVLSFFVAFFRYIFVGICAKFVLFSFLCIWLFFTIFAKILYIFFVEVTQKRWNSFRFRAIVEYESKFIQISPFLYTYLVDNFNSYILLLLGWWTFEGLLQFRINFSRF